MKDPAFLFYPNDYLGGTLGMTFEEKGAYIELLMLQFNRGHMTTHMIGQTLGQNAGQLWDTLRSKFSQDENGNFFNQRLEQEQTKRKAYSDSRRNNIKGKNQYTKYEKTGHMEGHTTSHMENENINIYSNRFILNINEVENFLKTDERWMQETVCMRHSITMEQAGEYIHEFVETLKDRAEKEKTPKEAQMHFSNWIKLQRQKEKQNDTAQKNSNTNTQERRAELLMQEYQAIVGSTPEV